MSKARDLGNLLDTSGDVVSGSLDNVPTPSKTSIEALGIGVPAANLTGTIANARIPAGAVTQHVTPFDPAQLEMNQAILAFKIASSNQLAKFSMVDQVIDEYQDATGIDAGASTNELVSGSGTAKYYEGGVAGADPTGGNSSGTYSTGGVTYAWRAFTTTGSQNLVLDAAGSLDIMLIAGGGGGGGGSASTEGGGGGAGGLKYYVNRTVAAGTHAVVVGTGGAGSTGSPDKGDDGVATTFTASGLSALSATGGGGAGSRNTGAKDGRDGGSGGGGGQRDDTVANYGNGITNEGNRGGSGHQGAMAGGGGGGYSSPGVDATSGGGGNGGAGVVEGTTSVYDWESGSSTILKINGAASSYAGGGAGRGASSNGTATHGGGNPGSVGSANTGGGGGGNTSSTGNAGGSGLAIIRYVPGSFNSAGSNLTLQSTATTAESAPTTADLVVLIEDGAGTATVNTDIKGYVSRNGSAFSSAVTFVDEGDWGTNKRILVARNVDISGITSGTAMKYKLTTHNQVASSKETRIHATSLAWA